MSRWIPNASRRLLALGAVAGSLVIGSFVASPSQAFVPTPAPAVEQNVVPVWYDRHGNWHSNRPRHRRIVRVERRGPDWCYYRGMHPRTGWLCH